MDTPQYIKNTELLDWRNGIVTVDGIEIKFVNKKARSFHADLVCIDEGAMLTDKDWNGAWGSREMTGSKKFIAISTPHRESSFVDIVRDPGRYGFKIHTWSKFDLPWYTKADQEADIVFYKGTNTAAYKAEVLGVVPEVMSRFILKDKVRRILVDLPWQSEGGRMIAGLDLSEGGQAPICILIAEILENKAKVAYVEEFPKQTIDQCMPKIEEILTKFQVEKIHIDSRPDPVSKEASSMVSIPNERIDFRGKKRDMLEHIMKMMDLKRLQIWSGWSKLVREMELYTIDHESYDDQIDSLCLALWDSDKMEEKQVIYPIPRKKYRYR